MRRIFLLALHPGAATPFYHALQKEGYSVYVHLKRGRMPSIEGFDLAVMFWQGESVEKGSGKLNAVFFIPRAKRIQADSAI